MIWFNFTIGYIERRGNIIFARFRNYFSGPARVHKKSIAFVLLLCILNINVSIVGIINTNHMGSILFGVNIYILIIIAMTYLLQLISKDTLETIFMDIGLCFCFLASLIKALDGLFIELPTFLTEYSAHIQSMGLGLIFLIYKFIKSRKKKL